MSKRKQAQSWKKLMRQREQERNRFGGSRQIFNGITDLQDTDIEFDEDEDSAEYEYLWAEGIRTFAAQ